ncbi:MAG: alanine racemase [Bdellovibrionia bacterium]
MSLDKRMEKLLAHREVKHKEIPPRLEVELSASALINNYEAIQSLVPGQLILPMLKANAYGHGAEWASRLLEKMPGLYGLGVATLEEGAQLRKVLSVRKASKVGSKTSLKESLRKRMVSILVFTGTVDWSEEKGEFCEEFGLTPVLASEVGWTRFLKGGWPTRLSYELQFNTGMNRLGIEPSFIPALIKGFKTLPESAFPCGIFSHLAMSERPEDPLSKIQLERFIKIRRDLKSLLPHAYFHLSNSGGIWNHKHFGISELTEVVRPGLSLYGIPPWPGAPERGISSVMTVRSRVVAIHRLKPGDSIGYGGTFKVQGREQVCAAIVSAGYADGINRALSNQGFAWLNGKSTRFLGVVSMDLCAIQCWPDTSVGDSVEFLGPHVDPWSQAKKAGTIPYELFTSLSERVKRIYV